MEEGFGIFSARIKVRVDITRYRIVLVMIPARRRCRPADDGMASPIVEGLGLWPGEQPSGFMAGQGPLHGYAHIRPPLCADRVSGYTLFLCIPPSKAID